MGHRLAPGVSCCRLDGGFVFLDRKADRYLFLGGAFAETFDRIASQAATVAADTRRRDSLIAAGILEGAPEARVAVCVSVSPRESLLDRLPARIGMGKRLAAAARVEGSRCALRLLGLNRTLAAIESRKGRLVEKPVSHEVIASVVAPFAAPGWFRKADGECLRRSIGLIHALTSQGIPATLVMGVKLRPFAAHCWVQNDLLLLNERYDRVRDFTPILTL
jgi:hypothetical protein